MSKPLHVVVTASSSGGHLFPAKFVIEELLKIHPTPQFYFIGVGRELEVKILGDLPLERTVIAVSGVNNRGLKGIVKFIAALPQAFRIVTKLYRRVKPDLVFGAGGYVTVIPILAAWLMRIPTWIHEAEPLPGKANWLLSLVARRTSVVVKDAKLPWLATPVVTGHPVRSGLEMARVRASSLKQTPQNILVLGGSQGATALDLGVSNLAPQLKDLGLSLWHQTRQENVDRVRANYAAAGTKAEVMPFITDMVGAYTWADIIIARAGAGTVWEVAAIQKPAIFVPLPSVAQELNAQILVKRGQAVIVAEGGDFTDRLLESLKSMLVPMVYQTMSQAAIQTDQNAASLIARGIQDIAEFHK